MPLSVRVMVWALALKFTVALTEAPLRNCTSVRSAAASATCWSVVKVTGVGVMLMTTVPPLWPTEFLVNSVTFTPVIFGALVVVTVLVTFFISPALSTLDSSSGAHSFSPASKVARSVLLIT